MPPRAYQVPPQPQPQGPFPASAALPPSLPIALRRIPLFVLFPTVIITIPVPQQGTMLWIIAQLRTDQATNFTEQAMRFNGDTANDYADQRLSATAAMAQGFEDLGGVNAGIRNFFCAAAGTPAATFNLLEVRIPFPAAPGNKQAFIDWSIFGFTGNFNASGEAYSGHNVGLWSPGFPIQQVTIQPVPGGVTYVAGSQVAAYVLL